MAYHQITKDEVKTIIKMWDSHSIDEVAEALKLPKPRISAIATKIRALGYKLAKKKQRGELSHLIAEALDEL